MLGNKVGPTIKRSLSDALVVLLALASNTTRNLVEVLLSFTMPCIGMSEKVEFAERQEAHALHVPDPGTPGLPVERQPSFLPAN